MSSLAPWMKHATLWWYSFVLRVRIGPASSRGRRFNYTLTIAGVEPGVQPLRLVYDRVGPPTFAEVAFEGAVVVE